MTDKTRILFWATTMQANVFTLARYLDRRDDLEVVVVLQNLDQYLGEPILALAPLGCRLLDRANPKTLPFLKAWKPHVTFVDNHLPPRQLSPLLVDLWHGFGWKGPEDRAQFKDFYKAIKRCTGIGPDRPNPHFLWISAGETNRRYRIEVTGFHPENVLALGQCYTDDLVRPPFTREAALAHYPESFRGKKICLFAPTWHFGTIFAHWGDDLPLIEALERRVADLGAALVLRMHDRKRFAAAHVRALEGLCHRPGSAVWLKWKDTQQDNLQDMVVADCLLSNYSSMLTFYYGTKRPSLHISPVAEGQQDFSYRVWKLGRVREIKARDQGHAWSLPPEDTGGLVSHTPEELFAQLETALSDPDCCRAASEAFIARHCAPYDGQRCQALLAAVEERLAQLG